MINRVRKLLDENQITIDEYNKYMKDKHKSQLSITGYSNYSELNNSKNSSSLTKNQTVLFGQNFANTSKNGSEASLFKLK